MANQIIDFSIIWIKVVRLVNYTYQKLNSFGKLRRSSCSAKYLETSLTKKTLPLNSSNRVYSISTNLALLTLKHRLGFSKQTVPLLARRGRKVLTKQIEGLGAPIENTPLKKRCRL